MNLNPNGVNTVRQKSRLGDCLQAGSLINKVLGELGENISKMSKSLYRIWKQLVLRGAEMGLESKD